MRRYVYGAVAAVAAVVVGSSIVAAKQVPTIRPNTFVGTIPVGGLSKDEAQRQVRIWWEEQKQTQLAIHLVNPDGAVGKDLPARGPSKLGVTVDDKATVDALPLSDFTANAANAVHIEPEKVEVQPILKAQAADQTGLAQEVAALEPPTHTAKVFYNQGGIVIQHEAPALTVDWTKLLPSVVTAIQNKTAVELPLVATAKRIPDQDLDQIRDVVSQFSTRFPSSNRPRCSNIKLASSKLNGIVLMPGEKLSFNGTVGRRTLKSGFKLAEFTKTENTIRESEAVFARSAPRFTTLPCSLTLRFAKDLITRFRLPMFL